MKKKEPVSESPREILTLCRFIVLERVRLTHGCMYRVESIRLLSPAVERRHSAGGVSWWIKLSLLTV